MNVYAPRGGGPRGDGRRGGGRRGGTAGLTDRVSERAVLDLLVETVRGGQGRALVLHGDPGVGKTVLLEYLAGRAADAGCRVARVVGAQPEMELAFAGLHQLCAPLLDRARRLPDPRRDALRIAFGLAEGPAPDRFLVGLAVLSLMSLVAAERPLICVIDDEQWLDRASVQALGFAARRLAGDRVGLVFTAREPGAELTGLPDLEVTGLPEEDARALLAGALVAPLDARIRDLIIAETRGNPLALLELPRGLSPAELAGGFGLPTAAPLAGPIEDSFIRQLDALPGQTRRLIQLAAADPSGDPSLLWRASGRLGIPVHAAAAAQEAGLAEFAPRVRFRHPLARSAAYQSASYHDRRQLHAALAEVTDPVFDPDRRAWHRAQAVVGPDEEVAAELESSAGRAQRRGGLAAAAAFLQRAAALTVDPARHAERTLTAAEATINAGDFGKALDLLAIAEHAPLDDLQSARLGLLRGHIAFAAGLGSDAPAQLLLRAARQLEPYDLDLARRTYLTAWGAASNAGTLAGDGVLEEICRRALALPRCPGDPRPLDLLLEGLARLITEGHAAAAPALRRAAKALVSIPVEDVLRWGWMTAGVFLGMWDYEASHAISARQVQLVRDAGALSELPIHLMELAIASTWTGDFAAAAALIAEADSVTAATGSRFAPFAALTLKGMQGREAEVYPLLASAIELAEASRQQLAATMAHWGSAILYNGLARYADAASAALKATSNPLDPWIGTLALPELVEAAARTGSIELARDALARLATTTRSCGNDTGLGIEARCGALLSDGAAADTLYREAIDRLSRTQARPDLARAHLLYGEWLRRTGPRIDARRQLRTAYDMLTALGMEAFAERARRELNATGETVRPRGVEVVVTLTAQEALIAGLARDGLTTREIGARLFLSARTVQYHLRKVFAKLGISSRRELPAALAHLGQDHHLA